MAVDTTHASAGLVTAYAGLGMKLVRNATVTALSCQMIIGMMNPMTNPDTTALQALADKVEAGEATEYDFLTWRPSLSGSRKESALMLNAYNGSIDAAKSWHLSVLGDGYIGNGYLYCIWGSGKASVWEITAGVYYSADIPQREFHAASPARAWLLAIIRALIAGGRALIAGGREAARQKCQKCGAPNGEVISRAKTRGGRLVWRSWQDSVYENGRCCETGEYVSDTQPDLLDYDWTAKVVLTVAHLDHQPENCADENLRAWCQRCHNIYDMPMRKAGIAQRAREALAIADMFERNRDGQT